MCDSSPSTADTRAATAALSALHRSPILLDVVTPQMLLYGGRAAEWCRLRASAYFYIRWTSVPGLRPKRFMLRFPRRNGPGSGRQTSPSKTRTKPLPLAQSCVSLACHSLPRRITLRTRCDRRIRPGKLLLASWALTLCNSCLYCSSCSYQQSHVRGPKVPAHIAASLLVPQEAGHCAAKKIALFGTSSLSRSWPAERRGALFGLGSSLGRRPQ